MQEIADRLAALKEIDKREQSESVGSEWWDAPAELTNRDLWDLRMRFNSAEAQLDDLHKRLADTEYDFDLHLTSLIPHKVDEVSDGVMHQRIQEKRNQEDDAKGEVNIWEGVEITKDMTRDAFDDCWEPHTQSEGYTVKANEFDGTELGDLYGAAAYVLMDLYNALHERACVMNDEYERRQEIAW